MKPIKITRENCDAITAALRAANGTAQSHTFTHGMHIVDVSERAEKSVVAIVGTKKAAPGALYCETSGDKVPNAYKYSRIATCVVLERRASGWFLMAVSSFPIWKTAPAPTITLTASQDAIAVNHLRAQYQVKS